MVSCPADKEKITGRQTNEKPNGDFTWLLKRKEQLR
jgi:hypothetical protein